MPEVQFAQADQKVLHLRVQQRTGGYGANLHGPAQVVRHVWDRATALALSNAAMFVTAVFRGTPPSSRSLWAWASALCALGGFTGGLVFAADAKPEPGLALTFSAEAGRAMDVVTAPNVWLYVELGRSPTPFLPGGKFRAVWEGALVGELRSSFRFQAELNGVLRVEINGAVVLEATGTGEASSLSKPVQLNKGANAFKATFDVPDRGDAFVRLAWVEKGVFTSPIPLAAFNHPSTPAALLAAQLRLGRELFLDHRCIKCHTDNSAVAAGVPELTMDAPAFDGIGARRYHDWMARWILDPKSLRPTAQMPSLLKGPTAKADADAIAAFLASLKAGGDAKPAEISYQTKQNELKEGEAPPAVGDTKPLYERLHCLGCHNPPDAREPDPTKLSQKRIAEKFSPGKLAEFLRAPEAHYAWTRMPNFHLSGPEAKELEGWLFAAATKPSPTLPPTDPGAIEKGRKLVQTSGCLNCHAFRLDNQYAAPSLADLSRAKWDQGCLAAEPKADAKSPQFTFTATEREALRLFGKSDRVSLTRHVPTEFVERQTRALGCTACHGPLEGFPALEILGGKLKPEWAAKFIGGEIPHKVRYDRHPKGEPWLEARMPAFKSRALLLAAGLAEQHGYAPKTPAESPVDAPLAAAGRKLAGKDGGFSCISCHAVGPVLALEVFESEGINFVEVVDRLRPGYYRRWFRAPTSIDPQTKMPVYFDEGKSPLTEVLEGDGEKQISAVWEYLKLRDQMPAPKTGTE